MTKRQEILFNALFLDHYLSLKRYICHIAYDPKCAEDILQETFLVAVEKIEILELHAKPVGWLYKTAFNITLRYNRKQMELPCELIENDENSYSNNTPDTLEPYPVLSQILTAQNIELLYQHHIAGYTYHEIAEKQNKSLSAVKMQFSRIKSAVKKYFKNSDFLNP